MLNRLQKTTWMDKPLEDFEFILPRDAEKVRKYVCELASHHAFYAMCNKSKTYRLTKSQIETAAKIACEEARDNTKALHLTNDFDAFVDIATPVYVRAYEATKHILFSKQATFLSMQTETEISGFEYAYKHVITDVEHAARWGDGPITRESVLHQWGM